MTAETGEEPEDTYQTLSTAAVVAAVLGVLSPLVALGPLLVVLPCLAIVLALSALRRIAHADGAVTGRTPALIGLALGTAALSGWVAFDRTQFHQRHAQATPAAHAALDSLQQGDTQRAFLMTLRTDEQTATRAHFNSPEFQSETQNDSPDPESVPAKLQRFLQIPAVQQLTEQAKIEGYHLVKRGAVQGLAGGRASVMQTYQVQRDGQNDLKVLITLLFEPDKNLGHWRVTGLALSDAGV